MIATNRESLPTGFRRSAGSALIVPEPVSREREVWTRDEWKALDRAQKLCTSRGIELFMGCTHPECKKAPMTDTTDERGQKILRCEHKDRVFETGRR